MRSEIVEVDLGADVKVEVMPKGKDMGMMLCDGEVDALISPQPRASMLARPDRYRRLFPDAHAEEVRYFRKYGFYPIMHLVVIKRDLAEKFPELPRELQRMFDDAKKLAYDYYADSNYSLLVDGRTLYEQQQTGLRCRSVAEWLQEQSQESRTVHRLLPRSAADCVAIPGGAAVPSIDPRYLSSIHEAFKNSRT